MNTIKVKRDIDGQRFEASARYASEDDGWYCSIGIRQSGRGYAMIGQVLSVHIHRPGKAALIAKNGWPCSFGDCKATPTVEVRFTRAARGEPGYSVGSHGACEAHAEAHACSLREDASIGEGD